MSFNWSDLTCHPDLYNFCSVRSLDKNEPLRYVLTFKSDYYSAKVTIKYEEIKTYNISRALEVESISSENPELLAFLMDNEDILLAFCNIYRNAWLSGFHAGME